MLTHCEVFMSLFVAWCRRVSVFLSVLLLSLLLSLLIAILERGYNCLVIWS